MIRRFGAWLILVILIAGSVRAQDVALTRPITYIGRDGNVYLTDGTNPVQITQDAAGVAAGVFPRYQQPRLSPDGTQVAVVKEMEIRRAILLLTPGSEPVELWQSDQDFSLLSSVTTWSPDGSNLAFFAYNEPGTGVYTLRVADGSVSFVTATGGGCIGEAGGEDPARSLPAYESGNSPYHEFYALVWSQAGILFSPSDSCGGVAWTTPEGKVRWSHAELFDPIFAPDEPRLAATDVGFGSFATLEGNGEPVALDLPEEAELKAWSGDTILYRTRTLLDTVATDPQQPAGFDVYPGS
jgi:hypothetical protein